MGVCMHICALICHDRLSRSVNHGCTMMVCSNAYQYVLSKAKPKRTLLEVCLKATERTHMHLCVYECVCVCMCVYVCMCVCVKYVVHMQLEHYRSVAYVTPFNVFACMHENTVCMRCEK